MPISLKHLKANQAGQVLIIFALSLVPLCGIAGFCIDLQHTVARKQKIQNTMDAAVLAAARLQQSGATDAQTKLGVHQFINPLIDELGGLTCQPPVITVATGSVKIRAEIQCEQMTSLTQVLGAEKVPFTVVSESSYSMGTVEIAFMFDVSESMVTHNRLPSLRTAANAAVDILLPINASSSVTQNTRLAIVSFSSMVNAGEYFERAAGVPATRTYTHTMDALFSDSEESEGTVFEELHIGLYDAGTNNLIAEIGDGAMIKVSESQLNNLTVAIRESSTNNLFQGIESMMLRLSGSQFRMQRSNTAPYSLFGDSGLSNLRGESWRTGDYSLRVAGFGRDNQSGPTRFREEVDFTIFSDVQTQPQTFSYTLTSTCVWERGGDEKFSDAAPGAGDYLAHQVAWFEEDPSHVDSGEWVEGHPNRSTSTRYYGNECQNSKPLGLTNDRDKLIENINALDADHYTGGHIGVAWTWYLISENWSNVFSGTAAPAVYSEQSVKKAVILMTDGRFNIEVFPGQGSSDRQARNICDNMKLKNIQIFAVAFSAPLAGQQVLSYCASNPDFYFQTSNATELADAYKSIAVSLSELRLSH